MDEFQKRSVDVIQKIDSKYAGQHDTETTIIHLLEELGEVSRQLLNQKIGRDKMNNEDLAEEISDCMILLAKLADNFNINIANSIDAKLKELGNRVE